MHTRTSNSMSYKQLKLTRKIIIGLIVLCLFQIGMFTYLWLYKGNHNGLVLASLIVGVIVIMIMIYPSRAELDLASDADRFYLNQANWHYHRAEMEDELNMDRPE